MTKIVVLNDYQDVSQSMSDWGVLPKDAEVTVFTQALPPDLESRVMALQPFEVITCMRERTWCSEMSDRSAWLSRSASVTRRSPAAATSAIRRWKHCPANV